MQTKMNEDLVKILYQGTLTYYPNVADKLEAYFQEKFEQARKETEAVEVTKQFDLGKFMHAELVKAVQDRDLEAVTAYSQAIQLVL